MLDGSMDSQVGSRQCVIRNKHGEFGNDCGTRSLRWGALWGEYEVQDVAGRRGSRCILLPIQPTVRIYFQTKMLPCKDLMLVARIPSLAALIH